MRRHTHTKSALVRTPPRIRRGRRVAICNLRTRSVPSSTPGYSRELKGRGRAARGAHAYSSWAPTRFWPGSSLATSRECQRAQHYLPCSAGDWSLPSPCSQVIRSESARRCPRLWSLRVLQGLGGARCTPCRWRPEAWAPHTVGACPPCLYARLQRVLTQGRGPQHRERSCTQPAIVL